MGYTQLTPGTRGGSTSGLQDVSDTSTINLTNTAGIVSGDVRVQNSETVDLVVDAGGLKANLSFDAYTAEEFTVSSVNINNKYLLLAKAPTVRPLTQLVPQNGPPQFSGIDFVVTDDNGGTRLSWDGLPFEQLVAQGDKIIIIYT